ncbi:DinB family protein [Fimbriiglobus ruber]|uniref:DinB-like domain-containing protein n=1 Tax=Fimbriiglobus ruber TaxID=1908690 RepID=A0A225DGR6_9BACT|nr:DinB family protein [Fimbriiglobus ruber]OWK36369.1 hypothetical protein FRUB_08932 [Fimbriiglobus ruber]
MLATPADAIVYSLRTSQKLFHRILGDLKPADYEHQPTPGANCAAWIIGHLALSDRRSLGRLGVTDLPALPDGFEARFTATKTRADEQTGYGDPTALVALFDAHRNKLIEAVQAIDPTKLQEPLETPHPLFASKDELLVFVGFHTATHTGQISTIRRNLGYPPLM